jgi:gamma-glutamyltranspeptidase/glutathione hydrolase
MFRSKRMTWLLGLLLVTALVGNQILLPSLAEDMDEEPTTTSLESEELDFDNTIDFQFDEDDETRRDAYGQNGMVSSGDPTASAIGVEILKQGGNAADAAVAVAFALGLAEPAASGPGGSGSMLYYDAATGKITALDYNGVCPDALTLEPYQHGDSYYTDPKTSGSIAVVPGMVAGMLKANEMFGSMSMADVLQPVIELAENGAEVTPYLEKVISDSYGTIIKFPETERIFTNDGFPYMAGELHINPDYANTLRLIAEKGFGGFYKGEVARDIVESLKAHGGVMTMSDLAKYEVKVREPFTTTYRGYTVATTPPVSSGAVILSALNLAEKFPIGSYEHNSTKYMHVWAEIFKLSVVDNGPNIGDPDFVSMRGARGMITKAYANSRFRQIKMDSVMSEATGNYPFLYAPPEEESHTTHVSIIDKDGNMVSMTHTNANYFGTFVTAKNRGFVLQNYKFSATSANHVPTPGMRTRNPMSPVMILTPDKKPFAVLGSPGSERILTSNTLMVSNLIDYGMDVQTAIEVPRIYDRTGELTVEEGIDEQAIEGLKELGHTVKTRARWSDYFGGVSAVTRDPETGELHGGADPRRGGRAVGY